MIKSKKGLTILFGVIAGIIAAIVVSLLVNIKDTKQFSTIGEKSFTLLKYSKDAEKALFYIDQSSKYALQQAVYDLAKNGGISESKNEKTCGKFYGYSLWYSLEKDETNNSLMKSCFDPNQINDNLKYYFDKNLNIYLASYPSKISSGYTYQVKEGIEITGEPTKQLKFDIKKG